MQALDGGALRRLQDDIGGEVAAMAELIETFLADAPRMVTQMRRGVEAGNAREVNHAAHTVKSTAAMFGAAELSRMCRELERDTELGLPRDAARRVDLLAAEWARVEKELRAYRPG